MSRQRVCELKTHLLTIIFISIFLRMRSMLKSNSLLRLAIISAIIFTASSCKVFFPSVMFQTPKDYPFVDFDTMPVPEYVINPGDRLSLQVFSNLGYGNVKAIVPTFEGGGAVNQNQTQLLQYLVRHDGMAELPVIGEVLIAGHTIPQAEAYLKELYSKFFIDPFVIVKVSNRRVIVFNGSSSGASVVPLENEGMTLIEVLAKAGGITSGGKAFRVKIIRGDLNNPQIDLVDLSTVEGMQKATLVVQANDIIYVDPRTRISSGILGEISPILGLITSLATFYLLISSIANGK